MSLPKTGIVPNLSNLPDSKVHGANMGPIWGRQDPGGLHVGPMNLACYLGSFDWWISILR